MSKQSFLCTHNPTNLLRFLFFLMGSINGKVRNAPREPEYVKKILSPSVHLSSSQSANILPSLMDPSSVWEEELAPNLPEPCEDV